MRIAVVIPVHNEAWNIRRILYSLLYIQDYGQHQLDKIIVVCSGCNDGTDFIVREIAEKNPKVFPIIEKIRRGKASALNMAIKALDSEAEEAQVIVFISGDVVPQRESLKKLVSALGKSSVGCAISHPIPLNSEERLVGKLVNILWSLHDEVNKIGWHKVTGEMFAVKREIMGELPENVINDDLYIEYLVKKRNLKFVYVPDAQVYMWGPNSLVEFFEQRRRVNRGHIQFRKNYKTRHLFFGNTTKLIFVLILKYGFVNAALFCLMEAFSRIAALYDSFRGSYTPTWKMITTSKGGVE